MKEGYFSDDIFRRFLRESGNYGGDDIVKRFLSRAFSFEITLLWNELDKIKEKLLNLPYMIPPEFLCKPVSSIISCSFTVDNDSEYYDFDRSDRFVTDDGMVFTPIIDVHSGSQYDNRSGSQSDNRSGSQSDNRSGSQSGSMWSNQFGCRFSNRSGSQLDSLNVGRFGDISHKDGCRFFMAENLEYRNRRYMLSGGNPVIELDIPQNKILYSIKADGYKIKRCVNHECNSINGIIAEITKRISYLPVINYGMNNDALAPHCQNIIDELEYIRGNIDDSAGEGKVFFYLENFTGEKSVMVEYVLMSVGHVGRGDVLKYNGLQRLDGCTVVSDISLDCRYSVPDFGYAYRNFQASNMIWSVADIKDACMANFSNVLDDISIKRGSFFKKDGDNSKSSGVIFGVVVFLKLKQTVCSDEYEYWRKRVEEYLVANSPITYNYLVSTK